MSDPNCSSCRESASGVCTMHNGSAMSDPTAPDPIREALAEGLHKAMCFGPATLHNRLACERPLVYLSIAEAALDHPAMREVMAVQRRSSEAAFGALSALGDDLSAALSDSTPSAPTPRAEGLREALTRLADVTDTTCFQLRRLGREQSANYLANEVSAARAALAASPTAPGLDVERLARALDATFYEADGKMLSVSRDNAKAIAAEYARLSEVQSDDR